MRLVCQMFDLTPRLCNSRYSIQLTNLKVIKDSCFVGKEWNYKRHVYGVLCSCCSWSVNERSFPVIPSLSCQAMWQRSFVSPLKPDLSSYKTNHSRSRLIIFPRSVSSKPVQFLKPIHRIHIAVTSWHLYPTTNRRPLQWGSLSSRWKLVAIRKGKVEMSKGCAGWTTPALASRPQHFRSRLGCLHRTIAACL